MGDDVAIRAEGLSKQYWIGRKPTAYTYTGGILRAGLSKVFPFIKRVAREDCIWALKDVSFEVRRGEVLGIIGRNGSGKSTLLKILSRITEPTTGEAEIHGRVGSLLEVGTGFHPELTGRENIYMNGAILGMKKSEIDRKFDEIVSFAEVEPFLDTAVKYYSSGMYLRLAFAVAANLEPEILMVDEVLAVGDAAFQKKSLGKMGDVAKEGKTVLFVSHNITLLKALCTHGLYLRPSLPAFQADISEAISQYCLELESTQSRFPVTVRDLCIQQFTIEQNGLTTKEIDGSLPFTVNVEFELFRELRGFRFGIYLNNPLGGTVARSFIADWEPQRESISRGRYRAELSVPGKLLMAGSYSILLHASRYGLENYLVHQEIHQQISIHPPHNFNVAHRTECFDATVILCNPWELRRMN